MTQFETRRDLLRLICHASVSSVVLAAAGCGNSDPVCAHRDAAGVDLYATVDYEEPTADPEQSCRRCGFFEPTGDAACGTCSLLMGPVSPMGHCTSWSAAESDDVDPS